MPSNNCAQPEADLLPFAPISLEEMNATARMMKRVDRKYLLSHAEATRLLANMPQATRVLTISGQFWQHYRTAYLDSSAWGSYYTAAYKRRRRYKVRMRNYVNSGLAFLEVKTRGPRKTTVKDRMPIPVECVYGDTVPEPCLPWLEATLSDRCVDVDTSDLHPTLKNEYWRAMLKPPGVGRTTIDTSLAWKSARGGALSGFDLVFVETKSGASPSVVDKILWSHGHRPLRVSKFGTGLAVMHPELPANKWLPAIRKFQAAGGAEPAGARPGARGAAR